MLDIGFKKKNYTCNVFKDHSIPQTTQQNPCSGQVSEHFANDSDQDLDPVRPALYWQKPLNSQHQLNYIRKDVIPGISDLHWGYSKFISVRSTFPIQEQEWSTDSEVILENVKVFDLISI